MLDLIYHLQSSCLRVQHRDLLWGLMRQQWSDMAVSCGHLSRSLELSTWVNPNSYSNTGVFGRWCMWPKLTISLYRRCFIALRAPSLNCFDYFFYFFFTSVLSVKQMGSLGPHCSKFLYLWGGSCVHQLTVPAAVCGRLWLGKPEHLFIGITNYSSKCRWEGIR